MSQSRFRGWVVPIGFSFLALLTGFFFRQELMLWFQLAPHSEDLRGAGSKTRPGSGSSRELASEAPPRNEPPSPGGSTSPPMKAGSAGSRTARAPSPTKKAGSAGSRTTHPKPPPRKAGSAGSTTSRTPAASSASSTEASLDASPGDPPSLGEDSPPQDLEGIAFWTCSMHPSVKSADPGICPICSMDLTPVTKREVETGMFHVDSVRQQKIGVRTDLVDRRPLQREIRAFGQVTADESRLHDVTLRVEGWIQELFVDTTGALVKEGDPLVTLYSPSLFAAEKEYLQALRSRSKKRSGSEDLVRATRTRLRLWGLSGKEILALAKKGTPDELIPFHAPADGYVLALDVVEGAHVRPGQRLLRLADLDRVWVEAEVFQAELPLIAEGQAVSITFPHLKGPPRRGKISYIYPNLLADSRAAKLRVELENADLGLHPGMQADVEIKVDLGTPLTVPEGAVVYAGPRRLVFQDLGGGRIQPRVVELGVHTQGLYEVREGIAAGDRVVTSGNFLLAAESRIRSASKYWEATDARE